MKQLRVGELVFDGNIYPRVSFSVSVGRLISALEAGCKLPPIAVEKGTRRIIDGVCRWKALARHLGDDAMVEVEEHECADDNEAFLLAFSLNAAHGTPLTSHDVQEGAIRAERRGITLEMLAQAVRVPLGKIERRLNENTAFHRLPGMGGVQQCRTDLKPVMRPLAGGTLTDQQVATNRKAGGMSARYYVELVTDLVRDGLWEWGSPKERNALLELLAVLKEEMMSVA